MSGYPTYSSYRKSENPIFWRDEKIKSASATSKISKFMVEDQFEMFLGEIFEKFGKIYRGGVTAEFIPLASQRILFQFNAHSSKNSE
jgi:hypothetical protein